MNIPTHITDNLKKGIRLRPYQVQAIAAYMDWVNVDDSQHGLWHMATGSGKTLIMAAQILDLYQKGYRKFLFFVNSTAILDKTVYNFTVAHHLKYLFNSSVQIDGKQVKIKAVDNWESADQQSINIVFSTIQQLHIQINNPRENGLSIEDFKDESIVLLSDEAHHINAKTKSKSNAINSWEDTISKITNVCRTYKLLEFTATMPLDHPAVSAKYQDKVVFHYPLSQFRHSGYSKNIQTHYAQVESLDRIIAAMLLSEYRRATFKKHNIEAKPVVMVKSKTIKASAQYKVALQEAIANLQVEQISELVEQYNIAYLKDWIYTSDLALIINGLKKSFSEETIISIDTKNESEKNQLLVNTLESASNPIRLIFAVDKLNEGWDVLNLFDIVRTGDDSKSNKKSSISEAQLIGRGARYYPYVWESLSPDRRKWDNHPHELSICETLHFHANYEPSYISQMEQTLIDLDIIDEKYVAYTAQQEGQAKTIPLSKTDWGNGNIAIPLNSIPWSAFHKAIQQIPFYRFNTLKVKIPELTSINYLYDHYVWHSNSVANKNKSTLIQAQSILWTLSNEMKTYITNN